MSIVDYTGPVGQALNTTMPNLLEVAREQRALQAPKYQYEQAVSQQGLEDLKKEQARTSVMVPVSDVEKSSPFSVYLKPFVAQSGIVKGNETDVSVGQLEQLGKWFAQPENHDKIRTAAVNYQAASAKSVQEKDVLIQEKNDAIKTLLEKNPNAALAGAEGNDKYQTIVQEMKALGDEKSAFVKQRQEATTMLNKMSMAEFIDKLPASDKLYAQQVLEDGLPLTAENLAKKKQEYAEKDVTGGMKDFEAKTPGMTAKRGTPEYAKAYDAYSQKEKEEKTSTYAKGRFYSVFDLSSGKTVRKSGDWINHNEGKTIDTTDADVVAYKKHQEYSTGISRFVNRIDTLGSTIEKTMQERVLNQGSKLRNYTVQQLIKKGILGSGDVQALNQQMQGLSAEIGKVESGSIGISGATVSAIEKFRVDLNMPAEEFVKYLHGGRAAAKSVTDAMQRTKDQTLDRIYSGTGFEVPAYLKQQRAAEAQPTEEGGSRKIGRFTVVEE